MVAIPLATTELSEPTAAGDYCDAKAIVRAIPPGRSHSAFSGGEVGLRSDVHRRFEPEVLSVGRSPSSESRPSSGQE